MRTIALFWLVFLFSGAVLAQQLRGIPTPVVSQQWPSGVPTPTASPGETVFPTGYRGQETPTPTPTDIIPTSRSTPSNLPPGVLR